MLYEVLGRVICAVTPIIIGVTLVFFRNFWWRWQVKQSQQRGWKISERNVYWDIMMFVVGLMFLIIGTLLFLVVLLREIGLG